MPKISVILPTNRLNKNIFPKIKNIQKALSIHDGFEDKNIFTEEFIELISWRTFHIEHYIELTLDSLGSQSFDDFELIISHRYPEDVLDIVNRDYDFPIKLIREKPSIWHDLGDKYPTLCNNINTAVIHSSGELLWRLDDLTFFNNKTMQELWNNWENGYYSTSRGFRCIDFDDTCYNKKTNKRVGPNKYDITNSGWYGQYKPLTLAGNNIPKWMCWGFSSTISRDDFLEINGQDEIWDGAICGTDMEMGERLIKTSKPNRLATNNPVYEINDIPYKYQPRNDVVFRQIINKKDYKANCWKPTQKQMNLYREWHLKNMGDLDENWNKFLDVPYVNMRKEHREKRLGGVVYSNVHED